MATELTIYVPLLSAHVKVTSQPNHTIQDVVEEVARGVIKNNNTFSLEELVQFGIFQLEFVKPNEHISLNIPPIDFSKTVSSLEINKNCSLVFDRIYYRVPLIHNNNQQFVILKGYKTIKVLMKELFPVDQMNYELKLITSNQSNIPLNARGVGIRMDPNRSLNSYRIKEGDRLLVANLVTNTAIWRTFAGESHIVVIISSPDLGISKSIKFSPSCQIKTVKYTFIQKAKLFVAPRLYGIYASLGGDREDLIDDHLTLSSFPLPTPARLTCKSFPRKAVKLFGVDPTSLPVVKDLGCEVPEVLVILKELLEVKNGLVAEGIFRKAGSELEMKVLKQQLENGEPVIGQNIHSVATMIKRWFKELPQRILVGVDFTQLLSSSESKLNVLNILPPFYSSLLLWLFRLILVPARNQDTSLMDPKNIAIVWGPIMVGTNEKAQIGDDFAVGFQETKYGIDVVETNLTHMLFTDKFTYTNDLIISSDLNTTANNNINDNNNNNNNDPSKVQLRRSVSAPRQHIASSRGSPMSQTTPRSTFNAAPSVAPRNSNSNNNTNNGNSSQFDHIEVRRAQPKRVSTRGLQVPLM